MAKTSLKLVTYNTLRERIIDCTYPPSTLLSEDALTEELNVSRTPIRDAISRLEQEGLVSILPKKGVMVSPLSLTELNSIFEIRLILEPYVLRTFGPTLDELELRNYYDKFLQDDALSTKEKYHLDDCFHHYLMESSSNRYIYHTYRQLQAQNSRFRKLTGNLLNNRYEIGREEHLEILRWCLKKEWNEAANVVEQHLIGSKNACLDIILEQNLL